MAGSESAAIDGMTEKEIYHAQARAGNRIKTTMASIHMEINGLDQRRKELERRYAHLEEALQLLQFAPLNIGKRDLPDVELKPRQPHLGLCCETEGIPMEGVSDMTHIDINSDFLGKELLMKDWPESSIAKPLVVSKEVIEDHTPQSSIEHPLQVNDHLPVFLLGPNDKFYPATMFGRDWFDSINGGCSFPENTEGYWRQNAMRPSAETFEKLPWPVACEIPGYDPEDFVKRLARIEKHSGTERKLYRGLTSHRWLGTTLGCGEYWRGSFRWPDSYHIYLAEGVPPSRNFFRYIMWEHAELFPKEPSISGMEFNKVYNALPSYQA